MPGPARVSVDASEFNSFASLARRDQVRVAQSYFKRGGALVEGKQRKQATSRFGTETSESRMQTVDPRRPRGVWAGSVRTEIQTWKREATIGPRNEPHIAWVEWGSQAPAGSIPASHEASEFIGHRPVTRATEEAEPPLNALIRGLMRSSLESSTRGAGG